MSFITKGDANDHLTLTLFPLKPSWEGNFYYPENRLDIDCRQELLSG